jgi:tellurite resistance-related uncharacterized protein
MVTKNGKKWKDTSNHWAKGSNADVIWKRIKSKLKGKPSWNKGKSYKAGKQHWNWKGGRYKELGYILVYLPSHPYADNDGRVREHRIVMEKHIGRYLSPKEVIHHINGVRDDNRIENLELLGSQSNHASNHGCDHLKEYQFRKGQNPWNKGEKSIHDTTKSNNK